jgi:Lipocalin-like domain
MAQHPIIGTWALDSIQFEDAESGERFNMYGEKPSGYIMINADGHAMTLIADSSNKVPQSPAESAAVFGRMMAYAGPYAIEGDKTFTTRIISAWHPAWIGTDQVRYFEMSGDTLAITTAVQTHPNYPGRKGRGVVKWHRAG